MGKAIFAKATSLYADTYVREGDLSFDPASHVEIQVNDIPDKRSDRWDGAIGIRTATTAELVAYVDAEKTAEAVKLSEPKKAIMAVLEIIYENPDLVASFATVSKFIKACVNRYQSKL